MTLVILASGGLDSTVMTLLAVEDGIEVHPLFVDYGQRAAAREWRACTSVFRRHRLPVPHRMAVRGFGTSVPSGLTSRKRDVVADVYLPGRNLFLLLTGAAYATRVGANGVAIGLLDEKYRLFEDQSKAFLSRAEDLLRTATATSVTVRAPLIEFSKRDVLEMARGRGVKGTYSCHSGTERPCGRCVSCRERAEAERSSRGR